jgi:RNA polymerase sigma factor (sigma-70 family)
LVALQNICLNYWYPLYAWARRSGWKEEDAQDLIQSFFAQLLEKNYLERADPCKGKLRSFLLICLKRHAGDIRDKERAAKRDYRKTVSLDFEWAEGRYHEHQDESENADSLYDKRWAKTLLHNTLQMLKEEMQQSGKGDRFDYLQPFLSFVAEEEKSYAAISEREGLSVSAVKSRVFQFRKKYRELLLSQIAITLGPEDEPKDELMELIALF